MTALAAERGFLGLSAASLVFKVGIEAGLPSGWLSTALLAAAICAGFAFVLGRGQGGRIDGWRLALAWAALFCVPQVHTRVGGDGLEYYALAHSLVFDQDLRFDNEFAGLGVQPVLTRAGEATSRRPHSLRAAIPNT